jgi:uncharacterized protein YjbI with pentapeptide repeats
MADSWPACDQDSCAGACIGGETSCLAHVGADERGATLEQFSKSGELDARGVTISDELLQEIFDAAPHNADGRPTFSAVQFERATFEGGAWFRGATFEGGVGFDGATFKGEARFARATFKGDAGFTRATKDDAWFSGATFEGDAGFAGATFEGRAWFGEATFKGDAGFDGATFERGAWFRGATFEGGVGFDGATFKREAGFDEATFKRGAWFSEATFEGGVGFSGATFKGNTRFGKATFKGDAGFSGATFEDNAGFGRATFKGNAGFDEATFRGAGFQEATFRGNAAFYEATFTGHAAFYEATFEGPAVLIGATFHGDAGFDDATFHGNAGFTDATFEGEARFRGPTFKGDAGFRGATFEDNAGFRGATFERAPQFGPLLAHKGLNLDAVKFAQPVRIEASTIRMCCRQAQFPGGVQFRLRWADVVLDDTDIPAPSLLTGIPRLDSEKLALAEQQIARDWEQEHAGHVSEQPRLLSLQRANVAGLGLANVDLAGCRFSGAHNLDKLRLEADVAFKPSPARLGWEQRQVVADPRWHYYWQGEFATLNPQAIRPPRTQNEAYIKHGTPHAGEAERYVVVRSSDQPGTTG